METTDVVKGSLIEDGVGSLTEDAAGVILASAGMTSSSSRDCCDEGIIKSSSEDVVVGVLGGGVAESGVEISVSLSDNTAGDSCCDEGLKTSYPDELSDSRTSGAPSIESRRDWVEVVVWALPRTL